MAMKELYLLRHAEKNKDGELTEQDQIMASKIGALLPNFARVISSDSSRTRTTAFILTNKVPSTDKRAGFYAATQEKSDALNKLAAEKGITFFEAADLYNDGELLKGIRDQAEALNQLVDETLSALNDDERALIVSHDMTITPAMVLRGQTRESINYLTGYIITDDGSVSRFGS